MNHLFNIIKKELRELLTPSTVLPMILIIIIFAAMGPLMSDQIESAAEPTTVGLMNADGDNEFATYAVDLTVDYNGTENVVMFDPSAYGDNDKIEQAMKDSGIYVLMVIEPGYNDNITGSEAGRISVYWYQSDLGGLVDTSEYSVSAIIEYVSMMTSQRLIEQGGMGDAEFVRNPIAFGSNDNYIILSTGVFQGVTPSQISSSLMMQNMFISIIIMMIIIMIGSILVSSMGNEKENKTLETLLTLPVSRTTVVGGKIIGSAIVGLLFGIVYMIGMYTMMGNTGMMGGVDLNELGLALSVTDWIIVGLFLFMAIVCALGLCMILGAFAKNYRAAQMLIMPITILAMVPMLLTVFGSFSSFSPVIQGVMFVIPFSHPMIIMENLMFDNTAIILGGFVYLLAFAITTLFITVKLYKSDILLTGFIRKKGKLNLSFKKKTA